MRTRMILAMNRVLNSKDCVARPQILGPEGGRGPKMRLCMATPSGKQRTRAMRIPGYVCEKESSTQRQRLSSLLKTWQQEQTTKRNNKCRLDPRECHGQNVLNRQIKREAILQVVAFNWLCQYRRIQRGGTLGLIRKVWFSAEKWRERYENVHWKELKFKLLWDYSIQTDLT